MAISGGLYLAIFAAFVVLERPGLGIGHFYYLAIALVALAIGPRWGAAGGALAAVLYSLGVLLNETLPVAELFAVSAPIRIVNYVAIGAVLGLFAQRYRIANEQLELLAQRDVVTGLPNTRAFELAIDRRLESRKSFGLLVCHLDNLRHDEDRDAALRRVSDVLLREVGPEADVARIGGDGFAVLAPCHSVEQAAQLANTLERALRNGDALVTFGWSASPREGENALTLYRAADERLYARRVLHGPRNGDVHVLGA